MDVPDICKPWLEKMESGDNDCLKRTYKGFTPEMNLKVAKLLEKNGTKLLPSFIFGLPGESEESLKRTEYFIKEIYGLKNVNEILLFPMTPIPGSPAYKMLLTIPEMKKKYEYEDRLNIEELQRDWTKYFCKVDYNMIKDKFFELENMVND